MLNSRDVFSDTWVSVDDEGRKTDEGNGKVNGKKVGIFYFLWHDVKLHGGDGKIYDHSKVYKDGGAEALQKVIEQGPMGFAHYWSEPYFGYYRSDDEWVIRKHTYQLTAAGIDFIYIDVTNGLTYQDTYETLLRVWSDMRAEGYKTPQVMFHAGNPTEAPDVTETPAYRSIMALWKNLYSVGRYKELWFMHDGKPAILAPDHVWNELPEEIQSFFTRRKSWANTKDAWYTASNGNGCWPWADMFPQGEGKSENGELEQMIVMSGFWSNGSYGTNAGRSYTYADGEPDTEGFGFDLVERGISGKGLAFEEQFRRAIEVDPDIIMLVGWNEWWAGRWDNVPGQRVANTYKTTKDGSWSDNYYVDCFNPEFSRDIEPVKGHYNDNYYYQMTQNIRRYKGSRAVPAAFGQKEIDMSATDLQWLSVGPEYRDYTGDTAERDAYSYVGGLHYTNTSGRNDLEVAKVSRCGDNVYFYIKCAEKITEPEGTNWMNLFVDADCDHGTGWYGYDYIINRSRDGATCSVSRFESGEWSSMREICRAEYKLDGDHLTVKVSASALGLGDTFDFKWADNSVDDGDIMQFIDKGDAAPNDRFNYRYTTVGTELSLPDVLGDDMTVLKAGSYNAFVGGREVMLDESSTNAVFFGEGDKLFVPKSFACKKLALDVSSACTVERDGIEYVDISAAAEASGKLISRAESIAVIADREVSRADMLTLYRALY